jgi:exosortase
MAPLTPSPKNSIVRLKEFSLTESGVIAIFISLISFSYYFSWGSMVLAKSSVSLGYLALAAKYLLNDRESLNKKRPILEEKVVGYLLLTVGFILFIYFYGSASFQYISFFLIFCGGAMALWGASFFVSHAFSCLLIAVGLYPNIIFITHKLWKFSTTPFILENFMGKLAGRALEFVGKDVTVQERFIAIGSSAVEVAPGCSGFDTAISIASVGLLLGLFYKQKWPKIFFVILIGIFLALLINVPRVMLLAYVVGNQDQSAFEFWHGSWGGQVFMGLLFTPYYYLVMAVFEDKKIQARKIFKS